MRYPDELGGQAIQRPDGESLLPVLSGRDWTRVQPIYWEHEGNAAVRVGDFKLVRKFNQDWELYHMEQDRTELHDLAARERPRVQALARSYEGWAQAAGVVDWNLQLPKLLAAWQMDDPHG